jgi:hypothetical protein
MEQMAMVTVLKEHKANTLSQAHKVPKDYLMQFDTPEQMDAAAAAIVAERKRVTKQTTRQGRREAGADRFEGGGTPRNVVKAPETFEDARELMKRMLLQPAAGQRSRRR